MAIITDFVSQYCGTSAPDPTAQVFKNNYEACYRLAAQWEEQIRIHYMECEAEVGSEIWSREEALKATEVASRLYSAGNSSYKFYQQTNADQRAGKPDCGKPTLGQCYNTVKKYWVVKGAGYGSGWPLINAIKDIRTLTGCPLKEAKDFVEAIAEQLESERVAEAAHEAGYR